MAELCDRPAVLPRLHAGAGGVDLADQPDRTVLHRKADRLLDSGESHVADVGAGERGHRPLGGLDGFGGTVQSHQALAADVRVHSSVGVSGDARRLSVPAAIPARSLSDDQVVEMHDDDGRFEGGEVLEDWSWLRVASTPSSAATGVAVDRGGLEGVEGGDVGIRAGRTCVTDQGVDSCQTPTQISFSGTTICPKG